MIKVSRCITSYFFRNTKQNFQIVPSKLRSGQSLVELLIAIGIAAILLPALLTGLIASRSGKSQEKQRIIAASLLKEAEEATRTVRENDWLTFAVDGTYHPVVSGTTWILSSGSETINGFTRQIVMSDVNRDSNPASPTYGAIVSSGGTMDPSTKKVTITVSWTNPYSSQVSSTIYLTRLGNLSYTDTTAADFNNGTLTGTTVTTTGDGEVVLNSGAQGSDWCKPATPSALTSFDLPKNGVANAIYAITAPGGDTVFAGTGDNASGVSFQKVNISTANPPVPNGDATFDGYKTNAVFGDTGYAYLATDNHSKEIVIISLSQYSDPPTDSKYLEVGYFDAPGNGNGNSIYVVGDIGYMTAGNTFYSFSLSSNRSGAQTQLGSVALAGTGNRIYVVGTYAYVATSSTSDQLQIVDVSNPSSMSVVGNLSSGLNDQPATDVFVNPTGTRAYVVTSSSASNKEFFIINTETKTSPQLVSGGTFNTNGMSPKGVTVVTNNKAIVVGTGGYEYQVIDISNESSIPSTPCGELNIDSGVNGVTGVLQADGDAFSYIITGDSNAELKIIPGGAGGGGGYMSSGTFESQTIPIPMPVTDTSFNRFQATVSRPSQTDINFQVAVAKAVGGSCTGVTYNFVGPDGTSSSFFTTSITSSPQVFSYSIPTSINPGQCFRYKVYFSTSDSTQTPTLYQIDLNYSP